MNFANDGETPGTSQNIVGRNERLLLKDFIPVLVFNERTLERMKKMERLRILGVAVHYCQQCNYAKERKSNLLQLTQQLTQENDLLSVEYAMISSVKKDT